MPADAPCQEEQDLGLDRMAAPSRSTPAHVAHMRTQSAASMHAFQSAEEEPDQARLTGLPALLRCA